MARQRGLLPSEGPVGEYGERETSHSFAPADSRRGKIFVYFLFRFPLLMKSFAVIISTFAFMHFSFAQINLVPNYSFEEYTQCPDGENDVPFATGWENWLGTPDYFNSCSSDGYCTVPYSLGNGIQFPLSGDAYAGLFTFYANAVLNGYPWKRELIGIHLIESLLHL